MLRSPVALLVAFVLAASLACAGCGKQPLPPVEIEEGPDAEVTVDGLHRAHRVGFDHVWLKPDADFQRYTKLLIDPVQVAYKRTPRAQFAGTPSDGNFRLTERQMADVKRYFREAFEQELGRLEQFELVEEEGPDVLQIEAALIDLVVDVPTRQRAGSEWVFTTSSAQMTLVMELRDADSNEILARIAERREVRDPATATNQLYWSTGPTNVAAVRRTFSRWARILARRLAAVHTMPTDAPAS